MPKGYLIGHITVNDPDAYAQYVAPDRAILARYGAGSSSGAARPIHPGGAAHQRHVVIEFPSYAAAQSAYADPGYQNVADIRRRTANSVIILVEGI